MRSPFFNAHHAPIGAFSSFTLGFKGASGGFGTELGGPANESIFIGAQDRSGSWRFLPFFSGAEDESRRFAAQEPGGTQTSDLPVYADDQIARTFSLGTDVWRAEDLVFSLYSAHGTVPDPEKASPDALREALVPAIYAQLTVDNTAGHSAREACFGYQGQYPYQGMRIIDLETDEATGLSVRGVGQGGYSAIVSCDGQATPWLGFSVQSILAERIENAGFGLGVCGLMRMQVPAGERRTFTFALCFYRGGIVTTGLAAQYVYTRLFANLEDVARYAVQMQESRMAAARRADTWLQETRLSSDRQMMLAHAIRSYYGSTQLLEAQGHPLWIVNEGEYRMMNTLDLTVDHVYFELRMNPWVVRNVLDQFADRYAYQDAVRLPGDETEYPGGISFTHDMGVANCFAPPGRSAYEKAGLTDCFSFMTHEQLVNWLCTALVYIERTGDDTFSDRRQDLIEACFESLLLRDHPDASQRDGVMSVDSALCLGGAEITTYDSLDTSLGQARNNLYLAVKTWAVYVALARFWAERNPEMAQQARAQAASCAETVVRHQTSDGWIPAVMGEGNQSRIIPAIEGLIFPYFLGYQEELSEDGPYGELIQALRRHTETVLTQGVCLFPDGGWKISSTSDNSWLSKIYLCQAIVEDVLRLPVEMAEADAAHVDWLTHPELSYYSWSDQVVAGRITHSRYYPRGVTAILWLENRR